MLWCFTVKHCVIIAPGGALDFRLQHESLPQTTNKQTNMTLYHHVKMLIFIAFFSFVISTLYVTFDFISHKFVALFVTAFNIYIYIY